MRTLGIDHGQKRIGLALSDAGGTLASPLQVLQVITPELAIESILKIIEAEGVERIVVGLPLNMDDTIGPAAKTVAAWARDLARRANRPVVLVDERLSSFAAEQQFIDHKRAGGKLTRGQKKQRLDAYAAVDFLQAFLDGRLPAIELN